MANIHRHFIIGHFIIPNTILGVRRALFYWLLIIIIRKVSYLLYLSSVEVIQIYRQLINIYLRVWLCNKQLFIYYHFLNFASYITFETRKKKNRICAPTRFQWACFTAPDIFTTAAFYAEDIREEYVYDICLVVFVDLA